MVFIVPLVAFGGRFLLSSSFPLLPSLSFSLFPSLLCQFVLSTKKYYGVPNCRTVLLTSWSGIQYWHGEPCRKHLKRVHIFLCMVHIDTWMMKRRLMKQIVCLSNIVVKEIYGGSRWTYCWWGGGCNNGKIIRFSNRKYRSIS